MTKEQLGELARKYLSDTASAAEKEALEQWYHDYDRNLEVFISNGEEKSEQELHDKILNRLRGTLYPAPVVRRIPLWKKTVAAAAVVLFSLGGWYLFQQTNRSTPVAQQTEPPARPEQAVLITSDGTKIELGKNNQAPINEQNGITIHNNGSQLAYASPAESKRVFFNTLEVPRKGVYSVVLADGTKVWVNSLSALHYPTSFPGNERRVSIKGEGYFEVAKNSRQPFIIDVEGGQEIEVLGTHFNVNAYANEQLIKTTLLQGSVRVKAGRASKLLAPGEEAQFNPSRTEFQVSKAADAYDAISWKNGFFVCNGKDLQAILRQVMRWYDIEVEYQANVQPDTFVGAISRDMSLSEIVKALEITGAHFSLQGRKLTVLP